MRNSDNRKNTSILYILLAILMPLTLVGCGVKDTSPSASDLLARVNGGDSSVAEAAEAVTPTVSAIAEAVNNAAQAGVQLNAVDMEQYATDVQRTLDEVAGLQKAIRDAGYTMTDDASKCAGTTQEKHVCANAQLAKLRKAFPDLLNEASSAVGTQAGVALGALSRANRWATSVWICLKPGETLTGPNINGKTITVSSPGGAKLVKVDTGEVVNLENCETCHPNENSAGTPTANAECHIITRIVPPPGGNNGGGENGSNGGNSNSSSEAKANADAKANAEANAKVDVNVKVDVSLKVQATLVANGINVPIPPGTCRCPQVFEPVCVRLPDGRVIEFGNSCMATCVGLTDFVSCAVPTVRPPTHNDCIFACNKNWPSIDAAKAAGCPPPYYVGACPTEEPTPTCTPKPGDPTEEPTATRPPMTATPPPTTGPSPTTKPGDPTKEPTAEPTDEPGCTSNFTAYCASKSMCPAGSIVPKGEPVLIQTIDRDDQKKVTRVWLRVQAVNPDNVQTLDKWDSRAKRYTQIDGWSYQCPDKPVADFLAAQLDGQLDVIVNHKDPYAVVVPSSHKLLICVAYEDGKGWRQVPGQAPNEDCD